MITVAETLRQILQSFHSNSCYPSAMDVKLDDAIERIVAEFVPAISERDTRIEALEAERALLAASLKKSDARVQALGAALRPFAAINESSPDSWVAARAYQGETCLTVTAGEIRAALAAGGEG